MDEMVPEIPNASFRHDALPGIIPELAAVPADIPEYGVSFKLHQMRTMRKLTQVQFFIGVLCFVIDVALIGFRQNAPFDCGRGTGIICGTMFIIAGSLGMAAAKKNRLSLIISAMSFSLLSSIIVWVVIGLSANALVLMSRHCYGSDGCHNLLISYKAAHSTLIFMSVVEFIVSVRCAVCFKVTRRACYGNCCGCQSGTVKHIYNDSTHCTEQQVLDVLQTSAVSRQSIGVQPGCLEIKPLMHCGENLDTGVWAVHGRKSFT